MADENYHLFVSERLIAWYEANKRDLPWRHSSDPYIIWISEIILQQTRVAQGLDYFRRFVRRFPDISSLAAASEDEVLRYWQGRLFCLRNALCRGGRERLPGVGTVAGYRCSDGYGGRKEAVRGGSGVASAGRGGSI